MQWSPSINPTLVNHPQKVSFCANPINIRLFLAALGQTKKRHTSHEIGNGCSKCLALKIHIVKREGKVCLRVLPIPTLSQSEATH